MSEGSVGRKAAKEIPNRRTCVAILGLVCLSALSAACGRTGAPVRQPTTASTSASARPLTHVTLRLDYVINGYHAPFFVALAKGFYKDEGLQVDIKQGKGSATTIETVANGSDTFGFADGGTLIQAASKGVPVVAVASPYEKSLLTVIVRASSSIRTPKELEGHVFGFSPGGSASDILPAFERENHIDPSTVRMAAVGGAAKFAALASGKVDAISTLAVAAPAIEHQGVKVRLFPYADYGLDLPGVAIVTRRTYAQAHSNIVRRFLAASLKGFKYAAQHPQEAAQIVHKRYPTTTSETALLQELEIALPFEHSSATQGKPPGWIDTAYWQQAANLERQVGLIKKPVTVKSLVTNAYSPS